MKQPGNPHAVFTIDYFCTDCVLFVIPENIKNRLKKSRDRVNGSEEIGSRDFLSQFFHFQE